MFGFIKKLFNKKHVSELRIRVRRFSSTGGYYVIEYIHGFGVWKEICMTLDIFGEGSLQRWHPIMDKDFDKLVERGKRDFNTIEKIRAWDDKQSEIYNDCCISYKAINDAKNKYEEIEL